MSYSYDRRTAAAYPSWIKPKAQAKTPKGYTGRVINYPERLADLQGNMVDQPGEWRGELPPESRYWGTRRPIYVVQVADKYGMAYWWPVQDLEQAPALWHPTADDHTAALGRAPATPQRDALKMNFPWTVGSRAWKALDEQMREMENYERRAMTLNREDRTLDEHVKLVGSMLGAMVTLKARIKDAETALYR